MQINAIQNSIEAILFASGDPVETQTLARAVGVDAATAERLVNSINDKYDESGSPFQILRLGGAIQMATRPEYADTVRAAIEIKRNTPLSQAALETLAVIAYNQPVTKSFVEQVRGVDSSSVVNLLVEKGLAEEAGRLELPGRPVVYRTGANFLRCFGLNSIDQLPQLPEGDDEASEEVMDGQIGFEDNS